MWPRDGIQNGKGEKSVEKFRTILRGKFITRCEKVVMSEKKDDKQKRVIGSQITFVKQVPKFLQKMGGIQEPDIKSKVR